MNAHDKVGGKVSMTSREFNQHTSRAKAAADSGPVIITDRGKPAYVLLSHDEFERLSGNKKPFKSLYDALVDPNIPEGDEFDLMDYIPKREVEPIHFSFDDDA